MTRTRDWYAAAHRGFCELVGELSAVPEEQRATLLAAPGLGEWDVRTLLGHTTRSYVTLDEYLALDPTGAELLADAEAYYARAAEATHAGPARIIARGVQAGLALGDDPVTAALALAERVYAQVADEPDDRVAVTPLGELTLITYLETRAFELSVHSLDLSRATGVAPGSALVEAAGRAGVLAARLAASRGHGVEVTLALTGRASLPPGFGSL